MTAPHASATAARFCRWRFTLRISLALAVAVGGIPSSLHMRLLAQTRPDARVVSQNLLDALRKHGDLTLRNATLGGALFTISELWKINIVIGDDVQGQVNGVFKKAPLSEILDAILLANGYSYRPVGESLVVMRLESLGRLNPLFESATIVVEKGDVQEIVTSAKLFSSPGGEIRAIDSADTVFVLDFADRVAMIREFIANIDANSKPPADSVLSDLPPEPLSVAHFSTQYVSPADAKEALEVVLSKEGKVAVIDNERRIVVVDYPPQLAQVKSVLDQIDIPRPQVRIYALVYDISLEDLEELGFNWDHAVKGRFDESGDPQTLFSLGSITKVPFTEGSPGATMTLANLSRNFDFEGIVRALQTANDARLLADPNVTVQDNEEAKFESITEIPFQQLTQTGEGGQIGTTSFREAGIKLIVKPQIARDGTVLMLVEPEFSRLAGFTPEDNQPIIDTRRASTTIRVADRQTLVIGGLRQRIDAGSFNGVTGFKDLHIFGNLFRSRDTTVRESELLVFLMPEIISYSDLPKPRQMAAAETTHCRLNRVPVGEGCPPSGAAACRGGPCDGTAPGPAEEGPTYDPSYELIQPGTEDIDSVTPLESGMRSTMPPPQAVRGAANNLAVPVYPSTSTPDAIVIPGQEAPPALRTAYSSRFRATGGVYDRQQRLLEPAQAEKARQQDALKKAGKKTWWERVLRM